MTLARPLKIAPRRSERPSSVPKFRLAPEEWLDAVLTSSLNRSSCCHWNLTVTTEHPARELRSYLPTRPSAASCRCERPCRACNQARG
jgi:hypothetical protein